MITCRCSMCGIKNAGKINRGDYVRHGLGCNEHLSSQEKKDQRKQRRRRESQMLNEIIWEQTA